MITTINFGSNAAWTKQKKTAVFINNPGAAARFFKPKLEGLSREAMYQVNLSGSGQVINCELTALGGSNAATVSVKHIVKSAVLNEASAVLIAHNHPSEIGIPSPSVQDIAITEQIERGLAFFDIKLRDHLIMADGISYSMTGKEIISPIGNK